MGLFTQNKLKASIDSMFRMEPEWKTDNSIYTGGLFADRIFFSKPTEDGVAEGSLGYHLNPGNSYAEISFTVGETVIFSETYYTGSGSAIADYNRIIEAVQSVYRDKQIDNAVERRYKEEAQQQKKKDNDKRLKDKYLKSR